MVGGLPTKQAKLINIIIADDHPIFLRGLEDVLRLEKDFKVVAICCDGDEALVAVRRRTADILLLDLRMPGRNGLEVLRIFKQEQISVPVVLLAAAVDEEQLAEAVRLGLRGLVLKSMAPALLVQCIRQVHAGELWLEKRSVSSAFAKLLEREAGRQETTRKLTAREIEVVKQVAVGFHNVEIAKRLFISEGTVQMHIHNIYQKLAVDNRAKLTHYAHGKGLL